MRHSQDLDGDYLAHASVATSSARCPFHEKEQPALVKKAVVHLHVDSVSHARLRLAFTETMVTAALQACGLPRVSYTIAAHEKPTREAIEA